MSQKDTIERAYGSIPKEVNAQLDLNWIPTMRGIKFYWWRLIRKFTR